MSALHHPISRIDSTLATFSSEDATRKDRFYENGLFTCTMNNATKVTKAVKVVPTHCVLPSVYDNLDPTEDIMSMKMVGGSPPTEPIFLATADNEAPAQREVFLNDSNPSARVVSMDKTPYFTEFDKQYDVKYIRVTGDASGTTKGVGMTLDFGDEDWGFYHTDRKAHDRLVITWGQKLFGGDVNMPTVPKIDWMHRTWEGRFPGQDMDFFSWLWGRFGNIDRDEMIPGRQNASNQTDWSGSTGGYTLPSTRARAIEMGWDEKPIFFPDADYIDLAFIRAADRSGDPVAAAQRDGFDITIHNGNVMPGGARTVSRIALEGFLKSEAVDPVKLDDQLKLLIRNGLETAGDPFVHIPEHGVRGDNRGFFEFFFKHPEASSDGHLIRWENIGENILADDGKTRFDPTGFVIEFSPSLGKKLGFEGRDLVIPTWSKYDDIDDGTEYVARRRSQFQPVVPVVDFVHVEMVGSMIPIGSVCSDDTERHILFSIPLKGDLFGGNTSYSASDIFSDSLEFRTPVDMSEVTFRLLDKNYRQLRVNRVFPVIIQLRVYHIDTFRD